MSEPKFTPGPWTACFSKYGAHQEVISWHIAGPTYGSVLPICENRETAAIIGRPDMQAALAANAHLIAAAPDLYRELAAFVRHEGTIWTAQAVLAKARGEQ